MVQRQVETVGDEEYLLHSKPLLHVFNLGHHLVDGPDHPPSGLVYLDLRCIGRIGEAAQLGQDADSEAGFVVPRHVQIVQPRRLGELRSAKAFVLNGLAFLSVNQAWEVEVVRLPDLQTVIQGGEGLTGVAG